MTVATTAYQPDRARKAFFAILHRDLTVGIRELPTATAQMILQPLILLFIFGKILPDLGYARDGYVDVLFPGVVAMTAVLTAVQSLALPLVLEFSYSMEIEDRLLAPTPTEMIALEKMVVATVRGIVAAAVTFPIGYLMLGRLPGELADAPVVAVLIVLGALTGSALGLMLGTLIPPSKTRVMFTLIVTPLIFTGSCQYPWSSLSSGLRWFQVVTALNPLTYVSEGLRGTVSPDVAHIRTWLCVLVLLAFLAGLTLVGLKGFRRHAIN